MYVRGCEDRVSWHRDQGPCFQPADPSVERVSYERETSLDDPNLCLIGWGLYGEWARHRDG